MASNSGFHWGVDIGGSYAKIGYLRGSEFVLERSIPTGAASSPGDVLRESAETILARDPSPAAVGLGAAGLINHDEGMIQFSPNLPLWTGATIKGILHRYLNAPVILDNDCNVFAAGALNSGEIPARGLWLFITLGTGIGGTIINDGAIIYGTGSSGEFGHATVREGGLPCPCGSSGCWELYAGRKALEWYHRRLTGICLAPREISRLASEGDPAAREAFREYGTWFGIGLANLANCFAPEGFFVAGGLSAALKHFDVAARREYMRRCRHPWSLSMLENSPEAGAYGAASMASRRC